MSTNVVIVFIYKFSTLNKICGCNVRVLKPWRVPKTNFVKLNYLPWPNKLARIANKYLHNTIFVLFLETIHSGFSNWRLIQAIGTDISFGLFLCYFIWFISYDVNKIHNNPNKANKSFGSETYLKTQETHQIFIDLYKHSSWIFASLIKIFNNFVLLSNNTLVVFTEWMTWHNKMIVLASHNMRALTQSSKSWIWCINLMRCWFRSFKLHLWYLVMQKHAYTHKINAPKKINKQSTNIIIVQQISLNSHHSKYLFVFGSLVIYKTCV